MPNRIAPTRLKKSQLGQPNPRELAPSQQLGFPGPPDYGDSTATSLNKSGGTYNDGGNREARVTAKGFKNDDGSGTSTKQFDMAASMVATEAQRRRKTRRRLPKW
ncbi:hypothetical protein V6N13_038891 [Hibiscus sabdariffa]